jgi:hypothetical protein
VRYTRLAAEEISVTRQIVDGMKVKWGGAPPVGLLAQKCYIAPTWTLEYRWIHMTASVVLWLDFLAADPEVSGSILGVARFSDQRLV